MGNNGFLLRSALICAVATSATPITAAEWRGNVSSEFSYFFESSATKDNWRAGAAIAADVEFYHDLADNISLTVNPFIRIDQHDNERTHADLRELIISTTGDNWEFNGGISQEFWGVTESRHLVDVINQADGVEGLDGEDKLGQLMLNLKWFHDLGDFEFYLLPHFRERTFAGEAGRPYLGIIVDTDNPQYESGKRQKNLDMAIRWTRSFDYWDLGLHYFNGTARDPALIPQSNFTLAPRYQQVQQAGIDAQALYGDLSIKTEIVHRHGTEIDNHIEAVNGIEYTLVGALSPLQEKEILTPEWCQQESANIIQSFLCNDRLDLGIVIEHLWDERGTSATHPFQNDLLAGFRFAFNDESSSDALLGIIQDLDGGATTLSLEASSRIFESYRLSFETRLFANTDDDNALRPFKDESFMRVDLSYFF